MFLRSLAVLTLTSTFALAGCGDDKNDDSGLTTNTPSGATPASSNSMSDPSGVTDGGTSDATDTEATTNVVTGSSMSEVTATTTTSPSEVTTTQTATTVPSDTTDGETGPDPSGTTAGETGPDPSGTSTGGGGGFDGEFGPCEMGDPPCTGDAQCVMITDVDGNFCSPSCDMAHPCPDAPEGTSQPMCLLSLEGSMDATNCAYVCDPMAMQNQCPAGSTCKPIQGVGVCTFP